MDWKERINIDLKIMGGKPVIKGTRVPLYVIVGALAGGDSLEEVCQGYRLTDEDVRAVQAYAAEALADEEVYVIPDL